MNDSDAKFRENSTLTKISKFTVVMSHTDCGDSTDHSEPLLLEDVLTNKMPCAGSSHDVIRTYIHCNYIISKSSKIKAPSND